MALTTDRIRELALKQIEAGRRARLENASENRLEVSEPADDAPNVALPAFSPKTDAEEAKIFSDIVSTRRTMRARIHPSYDALRRWVAVRKHVYLVGPAGSGKTTAAKQIAKSLGLEFSAPSIGRETTKAELFGFIHAHGQIVRTMLRERWEHGGVILLDEFDYASLAVGTCLNTLTSSEFAGFPDATIDRHPDFILIATANTYGTGANATYIGSNPLNPATLDRFVFIEWNYDETLEIAISGNEDWTRHVQRARQAVNLEKINFVISPRATINGADGLAAGFTLAEVEKMVLFKGLDSLTVEKIQARMVQIGFPASIPTTTTPAPF